MKYILLSLFLLGCNRDVPPWAHPNNSSMSCHGNTCCYPVSDKEVVCVMTESPKSVIIYYKLIEK